MRMVQAVIGGLMAVRIGQMLDGKYRVVRVLGKGGMGAVYEGENTLISRRVAIKVLHPDLMQKPEMVSRFELEAQAAGRIQNDHINEVLDLGTLLDGSRFIVLEFLDGETLKERVKRAGRLTPMQAVHVVRQVLVGLSAAHRASIIHRDLKPGNVFILWEKLGQRDFVKIIDFGVSKFLLHGESNVLDTTHANAVLGTPHYMAPEQLRKSSDVDARADLYSVGVILYKAITGRVPYQAKSIQELIFQLMEADPVPASRWVAGLDKTFSRILDKATERDVAKRFQSADEFLAELEQWRMEMAASELPFFTEDGLISTMHSVSLRRGSSSEVSVPPVHIIRPDAESSSVSLSEISAISLATVDEVGPAVRAGAGLLSPPRPGPRPRPDTDSSQSNSVTSSASNSVANTASEPSSGPASRPGSKRNRIVALAIGVTAVFAVLAGAWLWSRADDTSSPPADHLATAALSVTSSAAPSATQVTKGNDTGGDTGAGKAGDNVLSIDDLPLTVDTPNPGNVRPGKPDPANPDPTKPDPAKPDPTDAPPATAPPVKTAGPKSTRSDWGY